MGGALTVWVVRGGENLRYLPWFDSENIVGIGWSELPESPLKMSRQELAAMMRATYPDALAGTIANNTGQVWNFINTIALGDLVVVPLQASRSYRIGRVVGPMALLLGDLPRAEQVELDSAGDAGGAGLAGLAGGEVAGFLGFPRAGPVGAVAGEEAGHEDLGQERGQGEVGLVRGEKPRSCPSRRPGRAGS